jgi:Uroporphyrinogen-III synthase HemD
MKDKTVAFLESRMRDHIASLVRKHGGTPFSAPALAESPDVDPAQIDELIRDWSSAPPDIFIFQTGVGTRALFAATDSLMVLPSNCKSAPRSPIRPRRDHTPETRIAAWANQVEDMGLLTRTAEPPEGRGRWSVLRSSGFWRTSRPARFRPSLSTRSTD